MRDSLCVCAWVNDVDIFIMCGCEDKKMWRCKKSSCKTCPKSSSDTRFYTQKPLHTHTHTLLDREASTHKRFYTQTLLHTEAFTLRKLYTQTLSHTQTPLHIDACTHRRFSHKHFYTETLTPLHTHTRTLLQTQKLFTHTHAFPHTDTLLNSTSACTDTFIHRRFYTQKLLHTDICTHAHTT